MKWKSLKRGLAILLSALMITSGGVSVYAKENPTPSVTKEDSFIEDGETLRELLIELVINVDNILM